MFSLVTYILPNLGAFFIAHDNFNQDNTLIFNGIKLF